MRYAWLGVGGTTLTSDIVSALQLRATYGVEVGFVDPRSAALKAGITPGTATTPVNGRDVHTNGDIIVGFAGKPVRTLQDLQAGVAAKRPGRPGDDRVVAREHPAHEVDRARRAQRDRPRRLRREHRTVTKGMSEADRSAWFATVRGSMSRPTAPGAHHAPHARALAPAVGA